MILIRITVTLLWIGFLAIIALLVASSLFAQTIPMTGIQVQSRFVSVRGYHNIVSWHVEFIPNEIQIIPPPNASLLREQIARLEVWAATATGERKVLYEAILVDLRAELVEAETIIVRH